MSELTDILVPGITGSMKIPSVAFCKPLLALLLVMNRSKQTQRLFFTVLMVIGICWLNALSPWDMRINLQGL